MRTRSNPLNPVTISILEESEQSLIIIKQPLQLGESQFQNEEDIVQIRPAQKQIDHVQYQKIRILKAKTQRMFLISVVRETDQQNLPRWNCRVFGHSKKTYTINLAKTLKCTCPDFYIKRKPCKHIYFMISQVAQFDELFKDMKNDLLLPIEKLQKLDQALNKRLSERVKSKVNQNSQQVQPLHTQTDCPICFEEFSQSISVFQCDQCKKPFHYQCIKAWKTANKTCPLCRHDLKKSFSRKRNAEKAELVNIIDLQRNDPLRRLKRISL